MPTKKSSTPQEPTALFVAGSDPLAVGPPALMQLPAELVGVKLELPVYDPVAAEKLLAAHLPRLKAIPADRLDFPRVDVDAVSRSLLGVYAFAQVPHVLDLYKAAAQCSQFDLVNLARLKDVTLILIHVYRKAEAAGALGTNAKVPPALDTESAEVEKRTQTVCENFFPDDPRIRQLRPGTGYVDRAYDLLGYADFYDENEAVVAGHVLYRATDKKDARRLAGELLAAIDSSLNDAQKVAVDQLRRAWTFLQPVYFEVRNVGLAGLRYDPTREERFPSVYAVGRKGVGRKKATAKDAAPAEAAGAKNPENK